MRSSTSPQIFSGELRKRSSVLLTVPSVEFSIGTTPKSARAGLHFVEHLVDRRQRQRAHRMAEVRVHGGLRERAFRAEERDLQRLLLREARGHDLAEQPQHFLVRAAGPCCAPSPCAAPAPRAPGDRSRRCGRPASSRCRRAARASRARSAGRGSSRRRNRCARAPAPRSTAPARPAAQALLAAGATCRCCCGFFASCPARMPIAAQTSRAASTPSMAANSARPRSSGTAPSASMMV